MRTRLLGSTPSENRTRFLARVGFVGRAAVSASSEEDEEAPTYGTRPLRVVEGCFESCFDFGFSSAEGFRIPSAVVTAWISKSEEDEEAGEGGRCTAGDDGI